MALCWDDNVLVGCQDAWMCVRERKRERERRVSVPDLSRSTWSINIAAALWEMLIPWAGLTLEEQVTSPKKTHHYTHPTTLLIAPLLLWDKKIDRNLFEIHRGKSYLLMDPLRLKKKKFKWNLYTPKMKGKSRHLWAAERRSDGGQVCASLLGDLKFWW